MSEITASNSAVRKRIAALEKALSLSLWSLANAPSGEHADRDKLRSRIEMLRNDLQLLQKDSQYAAGTNKATPQHHLD